MQETGVQCADTEAFLTGETFDGQAIQGSDSIVTVGGKSTNSLDARCQSFGPHLARMIPRRKWPWVASKR